MKYYRFDIVIGIEDNLDLSKFTLNELTTLIRTNVNKIMGIDYKEVKLKKQLQREIGEEKQDRSFLGGYAEYEEDNSQTRQSKETSVEKGGGKAERYLFNSDNVSSADTLKLNHKCPICDKDIYLRDDTVNEKGVIYHLGCYLFENHFTINDSLKDIWDNPEDDRWDKEYNPDLLPETLKNKEEKQDE